jgi:hypothetical protein
MNDAFATMEQNKLCNSSGNFAILTAIRRASPLLTNFAAACPSFISAIDSGFLV